VGEHTRLSWGPVQFIQVVGFALACTFKNILSEGELPEEATVKQYLTVQKEGSRHVRRQLDFYNLDMILAVGYRVQSPRGTQFRQGTAPS